MVALGKSLTIKILAHYDVIKMGHKTVEILTLAYFVYLENHFS